LNNHLLTQVQATLFYSVCIIWYGTNVIVCCQCRPSNIITVDYHHHRNHQ